MSRVNLEVYKAIDVNKAAEPKEYTALTTALNAEGAEIAWTARDDKYLILIQNTHNNAVKKVTFKHGNGLQGVCDLEVSLESGQCTFLAIESGRFKNVTGTDKGKVILSGDTDIKVAVFQLP